ncbi:unnamed protein product [Callosobruchus maculatus]|uniref:Uncharacterized protein n=1 Tax=Callosobruchus maculatus TaxID=64391 RepID=A0A653BEI0_CALMS|nr:unnamed protein product [Callosobruchus maculatus]
MDGNSFENWFKNTLPKPDDNSLIVLHYHSRRLERVPTNASG